MKIIIDEFERLARCKGYRSGNELFKELGGGRSAYQCIKAGNRVGEEIVKAIYNKFGEKVLTEVVDMEEETISGLKSKSIVIAGKLYGFHTPNGIFAENQRLLCVG